MTARRTADATIDGAPEDIRVSVSDRVEDVDEALRAVHDGFVDAGYMEAQPSGRRMHASYLNPGTLFVVARINGEAVGTIALIADGPFGLPSDRAFAEELDALRDGGRREVRETGSLAIRPQWRRQTRRIYLRMLAATVRAVWQHCPDAHVVLSVTPESARFTANLFGCDVIAPARPLYGAPAVLLRTGGEALRQTYGDDATPGRRAMSMLVAEESPEWLSSAEPGDHWPEGWLRPLLDEQGISVKFQQQIALMEELCPGAAAGPAPRLPSGVAA